MLPPAEDASSCFGSVSVNNRVHGHVRGVVVLPLLQCFVSH